MRQARTVCGRERHPDSESSRNGPAMDLLIAFGLMTLLILSESGGSVAPSVLTRVPLAVFRGADPPSTLVDQTDSVVPASRVSFFCRCGSGGTGLHGCNW